MNSKRNMKRQRSIIEEDEDKVNDLRQRVSCKDDSTITTERLRSLDIMTNILSRLPVKSLARFRCVCKQFCSLTYDPYFVKEQRKRAMACRRPGMICSFSFNEKIELYNFDTAGDLKDDSIQRDGSWEPGSYKISNSIDGLACAYDYQKKIPVCYLFNPSAHESAEIPIVRYRYGEEDLKDESIGLGFDDSTGKYKIVRIFSRGWLEPCGCEILTLGNTNEWRYIGETPCYVVLKEPILLAHGSLFWKAFVEESGRYYASILALDMMHEKFEVISLPKDSFFGCGRVVIRELRGDLCVYINILGSLNPQLRIWRMSEDKTKWIDMCNINIQNFFTVNGGSKSQARPIPIGFVDDETVLLEFRDYVKFTSLIRCYDIQKKSFRQIYDGACQCLVLLRESLVSPRNLIANI